MNPNPASDDPEIPFSRLSIFMRQVAHDVRNGLNAIDLEAAFIAELVTDPEAAEEVKKLRAMVSNVAQSLQKLTAKFSNPSLNLIDIRASDFAQAFRERVEQSFAEKKANFQWSGGFKEETIEIDYEMFSAALLELFHNAIHFREKDASITFRLDVRNGQVFFELAETKAAPAFALNGWSFEPLVSTRRSGYGLGLFQARRIIEAHGGTLAFEHVDGRLLTSVKLPVAAPVARA